jgi:hypothetical protein
VQVKLSEQPSALRLLLLAALEWVHLLQWLALQWLTRLLAPCVHLLEWWVALEGLDAAMHRLLAAVRCLGAAPVASCTMHSAPRSAHMDWALGYVVLDCLGTNDLYLHDADHGAMRLAERQRHLLYRSLSYIGASPI